MGTPTSVAGARSRTLLDMNAYQWTVLFAAWLGWGFDVFDGLLFNYVAPNCVPTLLHLPIGSPAAKAATLQWGGLLTSVLLVGWAIGGILFGKVADHIGRTKTLMLTMTLYALGTAACALAPNIWILMLCRIVASLGIGGEWAAGASMVAEVVPEKRRVEAGALLYTSAPFGLFLATFVNFQIAGIYLKGEPELSWRYVFLSGLIPAAVAFLVRLFIKEPERWRNAASRVAPPAVSELFRPEYRAITFSGFSMAVVALVAWWSCNAFIPTVATGLAQTSATTQGLDKAATLKLVENWKVLATNSFNIGGLIGTLLTVPASKYLGRKPMFAIYFLLSAVSLMAAFGLDLSPVTRLYMYFPIGLTVFGVFGSFTYYLPELFPTRLRGTGAGFCYNVGRIVAAIGPFLVGSIAARGSNAVMSTLFWVGVVPLIGLLAMPWVIETRGRALSD
ncbi:MAG TPA: MFS transporter [Chthonomonadaceae bacterium]|nr:MFS transporter [Chthonomonadaceae bacterium]